MTASSPRPRPDPPPRGSRPHEVFVGVGETKKKGRCFGGEELPAGARAGGAAAAPMRLDPGRSAPRFRSGWALPR